MSEPRKKGEPLRRYLLLCQGAAGYQSWSDDDDHSLLLRYATDYLPPFIEWMIVDLETSNIVAAGGQPIRSEE